MNWALTIGRSAFAVALGILVGAGAALVGIEVATAGHEDELEARADDVPAPTPDDPVTVVDVSRSAIEHAGGPLRLAAMIGVAPTDPAAVDLAARWVRTEPGDYLDVELARGRRALVLVHP